MDKNANFFEEKNTVYKTALEIEKDADSQTNII